MITAPSAAPATPPPAAPTTKVTVCSECLSVLFDGVGHDQLCSRTGG
ncbi:hypothetical protein MXD63_30040 [Frankia sp. Cpl3]|nr:hypothetical protein [Parafrankia colletiae]MCK9904275.1 hypothetical protein [Frankia sp. Cpl3]